MKLNEVEAEEETEAFCSGSIEKGMAKDLENVSQSLSNDKRIKINSGADK